eukprot:scaffold24918_cov68-Phaeocystis_antarctica.AAC.1
MRNGRPRAGSVLASAWAATAMVRRGGAVRGRRAHRAQRRSSCAPSWRWRAVLAPTGRTAGGCAPAWRRRGTWRERAIPVAARRLGPTAPFWRRWRAVLAPAPAAAHYLGACAPSWRRRAVLALGTSVAARSRGGSGARARRAGGRAPSWRLRAVTAVTRRPGGCASSWRLRRLDASALSRGMRAAAVARARLAGGRRAVLVPSWQTRAVSADARRLDGCAALSLACRACRLRAAFAPARPRGPASANVGPPVITPPGEGHTMHARCQ